MLSVEEFGKELFLRFCTSVLESCDAVVKFVSCSPLLAEVVLDA